MNYFAYAVKFVYRIKWWLIICPIIVALAVYFRMGQGMKTYQASTTIYTGIVSGYDIESTGGSRQDWNIINNAMDNLINIIQSQSTLKNVSMRLYARNLVHGDPEKDTKYLTARSYRVLKANTPPEVLALVDRTSEERTYENIVHYEKADRGNHVYGLFLYTHQHYSYQALRTIKIKRIGSSDMLEVSYENNDPGIVYNTLQLLNEEFVAQYKDLRFGETNNVIAYFESELNRVGGQLHNMEDSLRDYSIENRVINYDEQTKHVAALSRDYDLRHQEIMLSHESAERLRQTIERQIEGLQTLFQNNTEFLEKVRVIGKLEASLSAAKAFANENSLSQSIRETPTQQTRIASISELQAQLEIQMRELRVITNKISTQQYTKEGLATSSMIAQWLDAVLLAEKSRAELEVMVQSKAELNEQYTIFSPIGSTLKRKNRAINFSEQSYLSLLQALNTARLRQKNLQMTSATLKIINPPALPIAALPSKRRMMVAAAGLATFVFVFGFFLLLELLDRTLRDKVRTERITGGKVFSAFPGPGRFTQRRFETAHREIAAKQLGNATINYFHTGKPNIINILSINQGDGKSTVMESLAAYYRQTGMNLRVVSWNTDFDIEKSSFLRAETLDNFVREKKGEIAIDQADVVLVEYPPFTTSAIPKELLQQAAVNLLIVPANHAWKDTDQLFFDKAVELAGTSPLLICLNWASRDVVQIFTGLMPPFTLLRKIGYQIGQFGFTSVR